MAQEQSWFVQVEAKLDGSKFNEAGADISQIDIDFCGKIGQKAITYTLPKEGKQDICIEAGNIADRDIEITIWFVDGVLTNDEQKNRACMQQGEDKKFWQYVTWYTASFIVPAKGSVKQYANFQLAKDHTGSLLWCLVYYTKEVPAWVGEGPRFAILMRKAKFIDIDITSQTLKSRIQGESVQSKWSILILVIALFVLSTIYFSKKHSTIKKTKTKNHPQR